MKTISPITWFFLTFGLLLQVITFIIVPDHPIALISGMLGVCSVVLGAQGNILNFIFGFAQVTTYSFLCWQEHFYAELFLNLFYFVTMIYGVYVWRQRLNPQTEGNMEVCTRKLPLMVSIWVLIGSIALSLGVGWCLQRFTNDTQPYLDAFTTIPALVAQILMILVYREQWYIWLVVDLLATVMWIQAGNYCMAAQYAFWCLNCIYGYVHWTRTLENTPNNDRNTKK